MGRRLERRGVKRVNQEIEKVFGDLSSKQISDIRRRKGGKKRLTKLKISKADQLTISLMALRHSIAIVNRFIGEK